MNTIGFIGAGQMAKALGKAFAQANKSLEFKIADPNPEALQAFQSSVSRCETSPNNQTPANCDVCFLAVKPQYLNAALEGVEFKESTLIVSIVTGVMIYELERLTGSTRIIRVMPNTPCLIGQGASGIAPGNGLQENDLHFTKDLLGNCGMVVDVPEELLDSVTGISGSGPAYVYTFVEAMIDGGVLTGMPRDKARKLVLQTVIGAAQLVLETGKHPAELRDQVTSPGGTTIAALKALEETGFRDSVMSAVQAATERSKELGG